MSSLINLAPYEFLISRAKDTSQGLIYNYISFKFELVETWFTLVNFLLEQIQINNTLDYMEDFEINYSKKMLWKLNFIKTAWVGVPTN